MVYLIMCFDLASSTTSSFVEMWSLRGRAELLGPSLCSLADVHRVGEYCDASLSTLDFDSSLVPPYWGFQLWFAFLETTDCESMIQGAHACTHIYE